MDFQSNAPGFYAAIQAMIPFIEGRPCVHVDRVTWQVCHSRRISGVHIDTESVYGHNDWVEEEDARPGELTEEFVISYDCLEIGAGWWYDNYFQWYMVFEPERVQRAFAGDHSWIQSYLRLPTPERNES
ncbi:MAG: hypothetical protein SFX18_00220 [Pirellulales bacterium]|nr:hypothetical protein [Pirellulales bacterium]